MRTCLLLCTSLLCTLGCSDGTAPSDGAAGSGGGDGPTGGAWRTGSALPEPRTEVAAVVASGKLVVLGGIRATGGGSTRVDIFDPMTGSWSSGPALPFDGHHLAVAVSGDAIYLVGGYAGAAFTAQAAT